MEQNSKLRVFNTKTRQKEVFEPLNPQSVTMYVCGPTVYNYVHIGNARPVVVFDTLFRMLQSLYPKVTYARNITDIDDKIMQGAHEANQSIEEFTQQYIDAYKDDMAALNNLTPTIVPKATEHVQQMIELVQALIEKGHAYEAEGHVLFAVESMSNYGQLSNRSLEDMLDGARVEVAPYKKYAGDFVLWKPSDPNEPGWDSPWGYGRPGWHLECSAMVKAHLGETIDIHGGGRDLVFPHHENEVAQSCCAHDGKEYVRYWMHNGFVNIDGEKMSKSLGNFRTVRGLLKLYKGEVIRFALLSAQYRSEVDFSADLLQQSKATLDSFYGTLRDNSDIAVDEFDLSNSKGYHALLDDLNTPLAISEVHALVKDLNKGSENAAETKSHLMALSSLLGILQHDPEEWFKEASAESDLTAENIEALINERQQAKKDKNFARSDEIREYLKANNVILEDSKEGTKWRRA